MHSKVLKVISNGCIGLGNTNLLFVAACVFLFFKFLRFGFFFFCLLAVCVAAAYRRDKMCWRHSLRDSKKNADESCAGFTALHSPGTASGSSPCARSRSWALLCPWRWWCLCTSTCSPEWEGCCWSPPSPTGGGESMFSSLTSRHQNKSSAGEDIKNKGNISSWLVCSPRTSGPDRVSFRWICSFPFPFFLQIQGADYSGSCLKSNLT